MTVKQIVSRAEAVRLWNNEGLYDAEEWIVDPEQEGTMLNLHRRLSPHLTKQLRFQTKSGPREPFFVSERDLDNQATRGVRKLTPESAALFGRIIAVTDALPPNGQLLTVTEERLDSSLHTLGENPNRAPTETPIGKAEPTPVGSPPETDDRFLIPEEVPVNSAYPEGSVERILVNRYERDMRARQECIQHYGTICFLCAFDFVKVYGEVMAGFIHVHHLTALATAKAGNQVNPEEDLRPVCPNCHAVLHRRQPAYSLEEVKRFLQKQK